MGTTWGGGYETPANIDTGHTHSKLERPRVFSFFFFFRVWETGDGVGMGGVELCRRAKRAIACSWGMFALVQGCRL